MAGKGKKKKNKNNNNNRLPVGATNSNPETTDLPDEAALESAAVGCEDELPKISVRSAPYIFVSLLSKAVPNFRSEHVEILLLSRRFKSKWSDGGQGPGQQKAQCYRTSERTSSCC